MPADVVSYMLLVVVAARLLVDRALRRWVPAARRGVLLAILGACSIPVAAPANLWLLAPVLLALVLIDFLILTITHENHPGRAWAAGASVAIVITVFTTAPLSAGFNAGTLQVAGQVFRNNALAARLEGRVLREASLFVAGMLLSSFELHHLIVWAIKRLKVAPRSTPAQADRGRVIGYLERPLVFILIITGNYVSLGLLLAAKTLTRFGKLNNRAFAEYYLIGTLLSFGTTALLAVLFSFLAGP